MDEFALWKLSPCSSEPDAAGLFFSKDFWFLDVYIEVGRARGGHKAEDK